MNKNYRSSIKKWKDALEHDPSEIDKSQAKAIWGTELWTGCGYCSEFGNCRKCPLGKRHCQGTLIDCEDENNTMNKIHKALLSGKTKTYRFHIRRLLFAMWRSRKKFAYSGVPDKPTEIPPPKYEGIKPDKPWPRR